MDVEDDLDYEGGDVELESNDDVQFHIGTNGPENISRELWCVLWMEAHVLPFVWTPDVCEIDFEESKFVPTCVGLGDPITSSWDSALPISK